MAAESTDSGGDKAVVQEGDQAIAPVEATIASGTAAAYRDTFKPAEPITKPENLTVFSPYPTDYSTDRGGDKVPPPNSVMEQIVKGDKSPASLEKYEKPGTTAAILEKSGIPKDQAATMAADIEARLLQNGVKPEDIKSQMARINRAMDAMLDPKDRVVGGSDIGANNPADLSAEDRQRLVKDFALRLSNPEVYANQGGHNTCALTSMAKLALQSGDPAKFAEQIASVVNNKFAIVTSPDGIGTQRVNIDGRSLIPDSEARMDPTSQGNRTRGMAGQVMDALLGQMSADAQGALDNKKYVYLAANAGDLTGNKRSSTGEGMFEVVGGNLKFLDDSPQMTLVAKAQLSRMLDLPKGINFIHSSMLNEIPQQFRDQFTDFSSDAELKAKFAEFSRTTGFKTAEVRVNAPFLPGERMAGHGLHSVNFSLDGSQIKIDNHWGNGKDLPNLSLDQFMTATDSTKWGNYPRAYRQGEPTTPGNIIESPSKQLRMPNETDDAYAKRMNELRAEQDKANQERLEKLKLEKRNVDPESEKGKEIQTEMDNIQAVKEAYQKAFQQYNAEMDVWNLNKQNGLRPNLSSILTDTLGAVRFK